MTQKIFDAKKLFKTDRPSCADSIRATSSYPLPTTYHRHHQSDTHSHSAAHHHQPSIKHPPTYPHSLNHQSTISGLMRSNQLLQSTAGGGLLYLASSSERFRLDSSTVGHSTCVQ